MKGADLSINYSQIIVKRLIAISSLFAISCAANAQTFDSTGGNRLFVTPQADGSVDVPGYGVWLEGSVVKGASGGGPSCGGGGGTRYSGLCIVDPKKKLPRLSTYFSIYSTAYKALEKACPDKTTWLLTGQEWMSDVCPGGGG